MLNLKPQKFALSAAIFMNGPGQMSRSTGKVYWILCMGGRCTHQCLVPLLRLKREFDAVPLPSARARAEVGQ